MNEDMKRLIEVLNSAEYEVIGITDLQYSTGRDYKCCGNFEIQVAYKPAASFDTPQLKD